MNHLRYAIRLLLKSPGFALVAILTLALGIGANSAIFSVVDAAMLRPLPYREPGRLVSLWEAVGKDGPNQGRSSGHSLGGRFGDGRITVAPANLVDYEKQQRSFSGMAGFEDAGMNLTGSGSPERLAGEKVTANYFSVLGVEPAQGRTFLPEDDRPGANRVAIVTDELWRSRFGADPRLLGAALTLDGEKYTVVGIMPRGFRSPAHLSTADRTALFVPAGYPAPLLANHGEHEINVLARLKPGVTVDAARDELAAISNGLSERYPETNRNLKADIAPLSITLVRSERASLLVLLGAVGFILLIACANLANLLLVRAVGRQREIAIRFALGASRAQIIGELLAQSAVLALLGGAAGLVFGAWTKSFLVALAPAGLPRLDTASIGWRVLAFTVVLSLITGLICGIVPAWQASKARPAEAMRATDRNLAGSSVMRWRSLFMTAEVGVSMVLLVGAGLLLKSFLTLSGVRLGIATERVLTMRVNLPDTRYPNADRRHAFFEALTERVGQLPGVESAGYADNVPLRGGWSSDIYLDDGRHRGEAADLQAVSPGYFSTLGIALQLGRLLTPADREGGEIVAIVNAAFVRQYLAGRDPLARRVRCGEEYPWATIVGVVSDIRRGGKDGPVNPQVYLPAAQISTYPAFVHLSTFVFRAAGDPKTLISAVQRQLWALDKDQPVTGIRTYEELVSGSVAERRFQTILLVLFASLALILAMVGIYGVISYSVSQRIPEIGIRMAMGASRGDILKMALGWAMVLVGTGTAAGAAGGYALSRYLKSLLFEVQPGDPWTYAIMAILLATVALAACLIPARRAARVDPMIALHYE